MMQRFKVIVPSFNSVDYIGKTLLSIQMQTDAHFDVCVIDDASTLPEQRKIITEFCQKNNWSSIFHEKNHGAMYGIVHAIPHMNCQNDDVIIIVDGDDWLAHENVLRHLRDIYSQGHVSLTWGQCELFPSTGTPTKYAQPIPEIVIEQKLFREIPFAFWHPRTFKYALWRHISDKDFRDENGDYLHIMYDKAMMYPMLEMAGKNIRFVEETLYIYNIGNPLNDYANTLPEEHRRVDLLIRNRPRYATL